MVCRDEKIDFSKLDPNDLSEKLEKIGQAHTKL
jgi:hypothetical protein